MRNELPQAQQSLEQALAMDRRFLPAGNETLVPPLNSLGMLALARGDLRHAAEFLEEALTIAKARQNALLDQVLGNCAALYARQGRTEAAARALSEARKLQVAKYGATLTGSDAWRGAVLAVIAGEIDLAAGQRPDTAVARALPILEARFGATGFYPRKARALLTQTRAAQIDR
jgi:tetratricopeptide (TPR) repeat protein